MTIEFPLNHCYIKGDFDTSVLHCKTRGFFFGFRGGWWPADHIQVKFDYRFLEERAQLQIFKNQKSKETNKLGPFFGSFAPPPCSRCCGTMDVTPHVSAYFAAPCANSVALYPPLFQLHSGWCQRNGPFRPLFVNLNNLMIYTR